MTCSSRPSKGSFSLTITCSSANNSPILRRLVEELAHLSAEIAERLRPFEQQLKRLETIPGIKRRLAEVILAEIGPDISRFPNAQHFASWAGMRPGNSISAGKRLSGRTRKGSHWLRSALVEFPGRIPPFTLRTAISLLSIIGWSSGEAARSRRLLWDTPCWSSSTTS